MEFFAQKLFPGNETGLFLPYAHGVFWWTTFR